MKIKNTTYILFLGIILITACSPKKQSKTTFSSENTTQNTNYDQLWKTIDSLKSIDQRRKALSLTSNIFDAAVNENNPVQVFKAINYSYEFRKSY